MTTIDTLDARNGAARREPPERPEFEREQLPFDERVDVAQPLTLWERITEITLVRRFSILLVLAGIWQLYALWVNNSLMLPTFSSTSQAFWRELTEGRLLAMAWSSIAVLFKGYVIGVVIAAVLTSMAVSTRIGNDFLATLTSMFNPLPAIALLPLAMLWFGLGETSLIFVLVHAVLWPLALNTLSGFTSVSETMRMCGRNYGLRGVFYVVRILMPAALPSILTGLKIGWAFAWRTLIAAELVFGVSSSSGGLGWFIFISKNELLIANVFAGLGTVILIGLFVENVIFRFLEDHTVRKWGMVR